MDLKHSSHGTYQHQYHIVWTPKYRLRILQRGIKKYVEQGIREITQFHPEVEVITLNVQIDHVHLVVDIPPKYAVSTIVGKMKQNTSRKIRGRFTTFNVLRTIPTIWSPGFFSSTVGVNEKQIRHYVEFQEKFDKGMHQLKLWDAAQ